jgi:DNA-binding response OmpR family regulator
MMTWNDDMKKILIIEDDPIIARVYATKYSTSGFETRVASDGEEGLCLVGTFKPDLIHLDLLVPKLNGVEVIKHIRSRPDLQTLPIVVLSNTYQNRLVKAAMDAGATQCVSKATCTPRMMVTIMEWLRDRLVPTPSTTEKTTVATHASEALRDAASHGEFRRDFLERAPRVVANLRAITEPLLRAENEDARLDVLSQLGSPVRAFAGQAALAGFEGLSATTSALIALLHDLLEAPGHLSSSALRTIVDVVDSLTHILEKTRDSTVVETAPIVLTFDSEVISRRALTQALARIHAPAVAVDDPAVALRLLEENIFGLILLDVGRPAMSGFDLCLKLRMSPANKETPVVFVTSHAELGDRDAAMAAGGDDLIAKPFLPMELAVKALSLLRGGRRPSPCAGVGAKNDVTAPQREVAEGVRAEPHIYGMHWPQARISNSPCWVPGVTPDRRLIAQTRRRTDRINSMA